MNADFTVGRHSVTVDGIRLSFAIPASSWEPTSTPGGAGPAGFISLNKSFAGSQGAEAMIYWTVFPDSARTDPCPAVLHPAFGSSPVELARAISSAPGIEFRGEPTRVLVGGKSATYLELMVHRDLGCDPGYFFGWNAMRLGAMWETTGVGESIRVWVVDVDGTALVIAGLGAALPSWGLDQQIHQIVESVQFE
jgi:hypothetical protein